MKNIYKYCIALFCLLLIASCGRKEDKVTRGVYFWQSNFVLSPDEYDWLYSNKVKKLYLRFFDIDWNDAVKEAVPVGDVTILNKEIVNIEIVPVVFITNRTLLNTPDSLIKILSDNIVKKIESKKSLFGNMKIRELQIDCDWTEKTAEKYFALLKRIKEISHTEKLTATIRLHQVKYYKKTGVPPVDRGMLMFYNIGKVENLTTINSIYEKNIADQYMYNFNEYPLELDVVLPAFSWGVVFRNKRFLTLINEPDIQSLQSGENFKLIADNQYICLNDLVYSRTNLHKNDVIRLEVIDPSLTKSAAMLAAKNIRNKELTVALYHLNKGMIKKYESKEINSIIGCFN